MGFRREPKVRVMRFDDSSDFPGLEMKVRGMSVDEWLDLGYPECLDLFAERLISWNWEHWEVWSIWEGDEKSGRWVQSPDTAGSDLIGEWRPDPAPVSTNEGEGRWADTPPTRDGFRAIDASDMRTLITNWSREVAKARTANPLVTAAVEAMLVSAATANGNGSSPSDVPDPMMEASIPTEPLPSDGTD